MTVLCQYYRLLAFGNSVCFNLSFYYCLVWNDSASLLELLSVCDRVCKLSRCHYLDRMES